MTRKKRKSFTPEQKARALEQYLSGEKDAYQLAQELDCDPQNIYRWKTQAEEKRKGLRIEELMEEGNSKEIAQKLLEKELEIEMYQKKVAELTIINDLLKKLQVEKNLAPESELTGLIRTTNQSARKKKRVKR